MLHFLLTSLVNIKQLLSFLQITRGKIIKSTNQRLRKSICIVESHRN